MKLTLQDKRNISSIAIFTSLTSFGAVVNALIEHGFNIYPVVNEFLIGFFFGVITSITDIYFFQKHFRRVNFSVLVVIRTLFYVLVCAIVIIAVAASRVGFRSNVNYFDAFGHVDLISYFKSHDFAELLIYILILSLAVSFIRQINKLLGQNVLLNYITGRYQPPIEETKIVMFLDLNSSTTIAEKIGLIKNHHFLNDFFHDMTESILECKGKIYQYVGDEIVLTWDIKDGIQNNNCVNCFYLIQHNIAERKKHYLDKYGVYPEFKAGLHFGPVIAGEIGEIKKDIVFQGDTMNTTARIEGECHKYGKSFLASRDLIEKLKLTDTYNTEFMGNIILRGKEKALDLFSIEEKPKTSD